MRIAGVSDLHLEQYIHIKDFGLPDSLLSNESKSDVLVLAGDIMDSFIMLSPQIGGLLKRLSSEYNHILYVMGNHEHYNGNFANTENVLADLFDEISPNIVLLEKTGINIDGIRFFGGTMWTSFGNRNPISMITAQRSMNDYRYTTNLTGNNKRQLHPDDVYEDHVQFINALNTDLACNQGVPYVLITHHTASFQFLHPMYIGCNNNDLYHDNLDSLFYNNPNIVGGFCGHAHGKLRVKINNAEIILNARGYRNEKSSINYKEEILNVQTTINCDPIAIDG